MQSKLRVEVVYSKSWWRALALAWLLFLLASVVWAADAAPAARYSINQPAQPLADSLSAISRQTGRSLLYDPVLLEGRVARPISGQMSADEAVAKLLQGTGLVAVERAGALVVRPAPPASSSQAPASRTERTALAVALPERLAQASLPTVSDAGSSNGSAAPTPAAAASSAQKIEVTGTRLGRVELETALPVNVYTRQEIERSGQPSLSQFLAGLNEVSMGQGEGSYTGGVQGQGTVQLRGLPLGSTLVLINGRRVQAGGFSGANFFSLNLIPLAAVERVEVVPVGSSAVYGGDALAGVVNIILRKSIEGVSLSTRLTTGKGFGDGGVSIGTGDSGAAGGWMVLGSFSKSTPLLIDEREFFRDADYRRYGGVDARGRNCLPGTVTSSTTANLPGLNSTFAAIPVTTQGQPLTVQSFAATAGQANLCGNFSLNGAAALIHGTKSLGIHSSAYRNLTESLTAFGELTLVRDEVEATSPGLNLNNVLVPATNPNNPFGVPVRVTARLGPENGHEAYVRDTNFVRALAGVRGDIGAAWDYEITASVSRDQGHRLLVNNTVDTAARTNALTTADPDASLNPFATGRAASDAVLASIWSNNVRSSSGQKVATSAFVRGPLFELPAGKVEAIIGGEAAQDESRNKVPGTDFDADRRTGALFGELRVPLLQAGAAGERPWTLAALTLAARRDRYSDFGSASTYQGGLELRPLRGLLLRASTATSFKPPNLLQTNVEQTTFDLSDAFIFDPLRGGVLVEEGEWVRMANPNLRPETGKAHALGAVWEPDATSGTRLGLTAWLVRITNLIGFVPPQAIVDNEALFPGFVTRGPTVNGVPGPITRLMFAESNFGYLQTRGIDVEAARSFQGPIGRWSLSGSATRVTQYAVSIAPDAPVVERVGRRFGEYWAPKWKSRLSLSLDEGRWSAGISSRYLGRYKDLEPSDRDLGGIWTHDLSARLNLTRLGLGLGQAKVASLAIAIINVTNKLPGYASGAPFFDTSQGDWRGRFATVRLSVDW